MTEQLQNDRFLRALRREAVDRTPIWIMRQAGRYLPEYRETRKQAGSFLNLMHNPELACEVTLQPLRRFELDAAILFSDILTIPAAMGLGLHFVEGEGPKFERPLRTRADIEAVRAPNPTEDIPYVYDTIRAIKAELNGSVPLIGFAGSPWTLATYMVEGGGSKDYAQIKRLLFAQPELLHRLLKVLAASVTRYLNAQIDAGVNAVQIFDTWGGVLSGPNYREFSLGYMKQIVTGIREQHPDTPIILFTKGGGAWLESIADTGCTAAGVDWSWDLKNARERVGDRIGLQGNLDPGALYGSPGAIRAEVQKVLDTYGNGNGHVFNLGHGIHQHVDPANVEVLVNAVHRLSEPFHQQ